MNYHYSKGTVIPIIDLEISGECNLHCPTCWGTPHSMKQQYGLSEWLNLLKNLKESYGLESIVLTGGEPLLVGGIDEFIRETRTSLGLHVNLLTNAILLDRYFDKLRPFLTTLSIPLDGSTEKINNKIRGIKHYETVLNWISHLNKNHLELPLKIGTVVSSLNIEDVQNIGDLLLDYGIKQRYPKKDVWKLYQATPFGAEQNNPLWGVYKIDDDNFCKLIQKIGERYKGRINLTCLSTRESGGYCIIIRPNGNVVTNSKKDGSEHKLFDNIFEDTKNAIKSVASYHVVTSGINRLSSSYFCQGLHQHTP